MLAIASYPRSGSHLYRFLLEYITGHYTMGCPENLRDGPIFKNDFPLSPGCLDHVSRYKCLGMKVHTLAEYRSLAAVCPIQGFHLIVRSPVDALASHVSSLYQEIDGSLVPRPDKKVPSNESEFKELIVEYFERWSSLMQAYYQIFATMDKSTLIIYENLIDPASCAAEIVKSLDSVRDLIVLDKFAEFIEKKQFLLDVSRGARGRTWGGDKTVAEGSDYYLKRLPSFIDEDDFCQGINSLLKKRVVEFRRGLNAYPRFDELIFLTEQYIS